MPTDASAANAPADERRILISIATYNEIENLPAIIEKIWQVAPRADIVVIDDDSPDGTGRWCDEKASGEPRLRCVHRPSKLGLGSAILAAMQYATEHDYDYLLNMDADFSHHPRYIPALLEVMHSADVAIGSRYCHGGTTKDWPATRKLMSRAVNAYARWLLWLQPKDTSGGFRCYRVALLQSLAPQAVLSRGYSFQMEVLWRLKRLGARLAETPIEFADRERGQSKISKQEALSALWIIFRLGITHWIGL
ncbi:MAG TPA: polyprenol monophosphomannose synthase [Pirellulaceae bacterium]|nr:polyprenol monophosphomannose synthase [Pirellulaceae bacterium]